MKTTVHASAGSLALLLIAAFWISTVTAELFLSHEAIVMVKHGILTAMYLLIPALIITGASGFSLARDRSSPLLPKKKRRMPVIALNGLLVLLPAAFYLYGKAASGEFDTLFYTVQAIELLAGTLNLTLMGLNIRDGLRLSGRLRKPVVN